MTKQDTRADERRDEASKPRIASRERALREAEAIAKRDRELLDRLAK